MAIQNSFNNTLRGSVAMALGSDGTGDMYYRNSLGFLAPLAIGANGDNLTIINGLPAWQAGASPGGTAGGDLADTFPNPTIALNAVTFPKIQNIATGTILGRSTAGTGNIEALSASAIIALLGLGTAAQVNTGTTNGTAPLIGAGDKLPPEIIPSVAIGDPRIVATNAAKLAITDGRAGETIVRVSADETKGGRSSLYGLVAKPESIESNWILLSDEQVDAADIVSGVISPDRLGANGGAGKVLGYAGWITQPAQSLPGEEVTNTSATLTADRSYRVNNASLATLTLPTTAAVDTIIRVVGIGAGGWRIAQNSGQQIHFGDKSSTAGISGRLDSTHRRDSVTLICTVANTEWQVVSAVGNIDVVGA